MRLVGEIKWLEAYLSDGPKLAEEVFSAARAAGMDENRLKRAKSALGINGRPDGFGKPWVWRLPTEEELLEPARNSWPNSKMMAWWLLSQWKKGLGGREFHPPGVYDQVAWVSERLLMPLHAIAPEELIGAGALSLLLWAREKEDDFRQMYDCKRLERVAARPAVVKAKASKGVAEVDRLLRGRE